MSTYSNLQPRRRFKKKRRSHPPGDSAEHPSQTYSPSTDSASPRTDTSEGALLSQSPPPKKKKKIAEAVPSAEVEEWHDTCGIYLDEWVGSRELVHYSKIELDCDMSSGQTRTVTSKKKQLVGDDILAAPPPKDKHIECLFFPTGIPRYRKFDSIPCPIEISIRLHFLSKFRLYNSSSGATFKCLGGQHAFERTQDLRKEFEEEGKTPPHWTKMYDGLVLKADTPFWVRQTLAGHHNRASHGGSEHTFEQRLHRMFSECHLKGVYRNFDSGCILMRITSPMFSLLPVFRSTLPKAATLSMMHKTGYRAVHGTDEEVAKRWTVLASFVSQVEDKTIIPKFIELQGKDELNPVFNNYKTLEGLYPPEIAKVVTFFAKVAFTFKTTEASSYICSQVCARL